jgi:hypothetical protein
VNNQEKIRNSRTQEKEQEQRVEKKWFTRRRRALRKEKLPKKTEPLDVAPLVL